ncbi:MAG: GH92 family glycosyl hydrolase [Edaphobacter sp.]|uniref:GH92 family glycosyl hydrolase n=1 Tax=Edaphobacter sp. TaxID=1934404 RepID=UPI0023962AB9|nr:GH92 family glycosyl hydrolase [Edaphobacter sp.]MDE1177246.1 GH92 family glycosyl hydrolase [Edaphobacter sp.]
MTKIVEAAVAGKKMEDPLQWVDARIGTGGHGHTFPGAALPFGMVQLSPDTFNDGWDWCSGYHVSDDSIMGFSHTHLSGTGCGDQLDFLVMAGTGEAKLVPGDRRSPEKGYRSRFDHADERMEPGYYSVLLKDYNVKAELTATERVGVHRYTFPASDKAYLILDLQHGYGPGDGPVTSAELKMTAPDTLVGGHKTSAWGKNRQAYFSLKVSKKPERIVFFSDDKEVPVPADGSQIEGKNLKAVLYFKTKAKETILVKTGISGVGTDGAAKNVAAEVPAWEFDKVRANAKEIWRKQISKISVESANATHKRIFYTALYHMSLGPTLYDDVDGRYRGMDSEVHQLPAGQHNFSTFSLWDTFRAAHPAYTLIERERVPLFVNTLIRMAEQSPAGMPVWPLMNTETGTMTGYHSAAVISEACSKGFTGIDFEKAYEVMMKRAMVDDYRGLGYYRKLHFIPADKEEESVSKTFEYCYDDWSIAHVARKLGKNDDAAMLTQRSLNYRNYYDSSTGFMRPKLEDGSFTSPFNPIDLGHSTKWRDYTESNAWQTTFGIQHDPAGLIKLYGGNEAFVKKLDGLFTAAPDLPANAPPDIAGMVGQYAHGNEPSHHISYLYVYAGAPYKTQARARSLMETMYSAEPDGMQGNEDVGQMSAWYLLSALGFYPVDPVSGNYVLGSPLFEGAKVQLAAGKVLDIVVERKDPSHQYVQSFSINGKPQQRAWFHHSEIVDGAKLVYVMGPEPNEKFGADEASLPPSLKLA